MFAPLAASPRESGAGTLRHMPFPIAAGAHADRVKTVPCGSATAVPPCTAIGFPGAFRTDYLDIFHGRSFLF